MVSYNLIECSNCGESNLLYNKNCKKCKHYLRPSVVNIDLWSTIWLLFENPKKAIQNLIMAEHKNFTIFLIIFLSFKFYMSATTLQSALSITLPQTNYYSLNILAGSTVYFILIVIFSGLFTLIFRKNLKIRFKDNITIIIFAFIPLIFSLFILSPVEYGLFGKHWVLYNPSPFLIKNTLAYLLISLEFLMLTWSIIILYNGFRIQLNSVVTALFLTLTFFILLGSAFYFIPFILF